MAGGPAGLEGTLRLGRVVRAHGVTGELEVRPDWAESRGLLEVAEVFLEAPSGELERRAVRARRRTPKGILLALEGIDSRDDAEARRGHLVRARREALPSLGEGEYYLSDLVGVAVTAPDGLVGTVVEVQMYPSVDALVIEAPSGERFEQPLLDEWLAGVDLEARQLSLSSRDGLIEAPRPRPSARS